MPYPNGLDLNEVRRLLQENRRQGDYDPVDPDKQLVVDSDGKILQGEGDTYGLSRIHQATFAIDMDAVQLAEEIQIVSKKFPADTEPAEIDGYFGWLYRFRNDCGDRYTLFAYHDGSDYQVRVIEPACAGRYPVHACHVWPDSRLCLRDDGSGYDELDEAYAKSVLWSNGFSLFLATGTFSL